MCQRGVAEGEDIWVCGPCNRQWWACTECKGPEEAGLPSETSPLSDDFVTLVLLPLLQALPPPSLIDPVTAKAAMALVSANEVARVRVRVRVEYAASPMELPLTVPLTLAPTLTQALPLTPPLTLTRRPTPPWMAPPRVCWRRDASSTRRSLA